MRVCGIELKSNNCILTLVENENNNILSHDIKIKKIILSDDEKQEDIREFILQLSSFFKQNRVDKIAIKKRAKKGNFAGGAVTFKMEALIQATALMEVDLVSSQTISSYEKKNMVTFSKELKKYQEQAYLAALVSIC